MSGPKLDKVVRMLLKYELIFANESELANLTCVMCSSVISDAVQVSCGCKYCRECLQSSIDNGNVICPGQSEDCKGAPLDTHSSDYATNHLIFKLMVKCPVISCVDLFKLVELEDHLLECEMGSESQCASARSNEDVPSNRDALRRLKLSEEPAIQIKKLSKKVKRIEEEARERNKTVDEAMRSNRDNVSEMKDYVDSVTVDFDTLKEDMYSLKSQMLSIQRSVYVDVSFSWAIKNNILQVHWLDWKSEIFHGVAHRYKYQLITSNGGSIGTSFVVNLNILCGDNDDDLDWPFVKKVTVTVCDIVKPELCRSITEECHLEKPSSDTCSTSKSFIFDHDKLTLIKMDLTKGLRVSCAVLIN